MAKAEVTVEELVGMIERGELRGPSMQRRYVWRSTRVRDLLDSLHRQVDLPITRKTARNHAGASHC